MVGHDHAEWAAAFRHAAKVAPDIREYVDIDGHLHTEQVICAEDLLALADREDAEAS
jgi:hypothetical protein